MLTEKEKAEIEMLKNDEAVKTARKATMEKYKDRYKDRQKLYQLRHLKRKGEMLLSEN